ncbi:hypothetical protein BESB_017380 [Besnoitia besnoiti]|uniref:Transmembrane protein n=1 Tax=Besnoitia besnoiti TaxID=94643 RepID=A0A2A9MAM8_BESBE|nr:hypothetical protein BESB_017380 [Besnoitia besnoiti]PFH32420.1 hypothetical protein BESB_017380 [Besnoitia besnoiti]
MASPRLRPPCAAPEPLSWLRFLILLVLPLTAYFSGSAVALRVKHRALAYRHADPPAALVPADTPLAWLQAESVPARNESSTPGDKSRRGGAKNTQESKNVSSGSSAASSGASEHPEDGAAPRITEEYLKQQADLFIECDSQNKPFPAPDSFDMDTFKGPAPDALEKDVAEHTSTRQLTELANMYFDDVAARLKRHKREVTAHGWEFDKGTRRQIEQDMLNSQLCWKLRPSEPPPPEGPVIDGLMRVFHRLGRAFKRTTRGTKVVAVKIRNWFRSQRGRKNGGTQKYSRAVKFLKNMGALVKEKVIVLAKKIIAQVIRYMPAILLSVNTFFVATAVSTLVATPAAPLAVLTLVASVIGFLSFAISKGTELNQQVFTQNVFSDLNTNQYQTFGLVWAQLRAEEAVQMSASEAAPTAEPEAPSGSHQKSAGKETTAPAEEDDTWGAINEALVGAREMADGQTVVATSIDPDAELAGKENTPPGEPGAVPPNMAELENIRQRMKKNLTQRKASVVFSKHHANIRSAWREKRFKGLGKILITSLRMFFDFFNFAVSLLLRAFGSAWVYLVDTALRKATRFFRMLKSFQLVAAFFEKMQDFLRWLFGRARFYFDFLDPYRNLLSFLVVNRIAFTQLTTGTMLISSSSGLLFMGTFLWAVSKPLWSWYLTRKGMVTADLLQKAEDELAEDARTYKSFLLGSSALRSLDAGVAPFDFPRISETELVEIVFIMNFLDMYKIPNLPDASVLSSTSPSQSLLLYQRIRTLDDFRAKLSPANRSLFENTFSNLKTWDSGESLHQVHNLLMRNIQHCALHYGEVSFRKAIEARCRQMSIQKRSSPEQLAWFVHLSPRKRQLFSKRVFDALKLYPHSVSNAVYIKRTVKLALGTVTKKQITEKMATWAGALVHHTAVNTMGKQIILQLYKDDNHVVDKTSIRVGNVPAHLFPYREELVLTLKRLLTFDPPERALMRRDAGVQERFERIFLAESLTGRSSTGTSRGDQNQSNGINCEPVRPDVEVFPDIQEAALTFRSDVRECNEAATSYFLKNQIDSSFMLDMRRELYSKEPVDCAPFRTPALEALDILADEVAAADPAHAVDIADRALELVVDEHPAVASVFFKYARHTVTAAERKTLAGIFKLIQVVRNFTRREEFLRVMTIFLNEASRTHLRREIGDVAGSAVLTEIYSIISRDSFYSRKAVEEHIYSRLRGVDFDIGEEEAEKALWHGVKSHFARAFMSTMRSFRTVRQPTAGHIVGAGLRTAAFMYTQSDAEVAEAMKKAMQAIFKKARTTVELPAYSVEDAGECLICEAVDKLLRRLKSKESDGGDSTNANQTVLGIINKVQAAYERQADSLGRYFRWGEWFPQRHTCLHWSDEQIRLLKLELSSIVETLHQKKGLWTKLLSRLRKQWVPHANAGGAVASDLLDRLRDMNLYGVEGLDFRLAIRYAYKPFVAEKFKEEAAEAWAHAERQTMMKESEKLVEAPEGDEKGKSKLEASFDGDIPP